MNSNLLSIESEKSLLRAALDPARQGIIRELCNQIGPTDFAVLSHQHLWRIRFQLADAGVPHDVTAVLDAARKMMIEDVASISEYALNLLRDDVLGSIGDLGLTAAAKRIKDLSQLRTLIATLNTAHELGRSGTRSHEELLDYVSDAVESARRERAINSTGPAHVMNFVAAVTEQVNKRLEGQAPDNVTSTGLPSLDRLLAGGLVDGDLVYLAARPSMGKTALSLAIAEAMSHEREVLYFSTEQSGNALTYRMLSSASRIDAKRLKRGEFTGDEFDRFLEGARCTSDLRLHIDETSEIALPEIKTRARQFAHKINHAPMVIFVDYVQRLRSHRGDADPRVVIGEISVGLKNLAKELKCPVVALAQLNRELEKRANKRPMMSDLAESGKLEQDADICLFLYRDEYYNPDTKDPGITEVIVGKNREGAVGVAKIEFNANTQRFSDLSGGF
jgi:replicative DNA helicase